MRRKILVGIMSVAIWFNSAFCSMQVKAESETIINSNEAAYLAGMHVKSIISNEKNNSEWDWGVRLSEPIPMTDFLGNTSSYYFGVFDEMIRRRDMLLLVQQLMWRQSLNMLL